MASQKQSGLIKHINDRTIMVNLVDDLTLDTQDIIFQVYDQASAQNIDNIVLNLSESDYITSASITTLISVLSKMRQRKQRLLIAVVPHNQKVFRMVGLDQYATVGSYDEIVSLVA